MTKEQLLDFANSLADGEEVVLLCWTKHDVEEWVELDLTDVEWGLVRLWFEKYQDASADLNEAVYFATKGRKVV